MHAYSNLCFMSVCRIMGTFLLQDVLLYLNIETANDMWSVNIFIINRKNVWTIYMNVGFLVFGSCVQLLLYCNFVINCFTV